MSGSMAAPPEKLQPLHNFSLTDLKWAHKNSSSPAGSSSHNHHHCFCRRNSPDQRPEADSDLDARHTSPKHQARTGASQNGSLSSDVEELNGEAKALNLGPRNEVSKAGSNSKKETNVDNIDNRTNIKSQRLRELLEGGHQNGGARRKEKSKLWISLSKDEIEEDIFAMTGRKPSRRPKRRPKGVQKQLDKVFPGLYLVGCSADSYRVNVPWWFQCQYGADVGNQCQHGWGTPLDYVKKCKDKYIHRVLSRI